MGDVNVRSTIYLLHFDPPYISTGGRSVGHYIGRTTLDLDERFARHRRGDGAALIRALIAQGGDFVLARTWPDEYRRGAARSYDTERAIKRRYSSGYWKACPICLVQRELGGVIVKGEEEAAEGYAAGSARPKATDPSVRTPQLEVAL